MRELGPRSLFSQHVHDSFFCSKRSDNTTSVEDKVWIKNTTNTSIEDKERIGNTTDVLFKDREWIENSTKIFEKLMKNYDSSMAPFVPGM